MGCDGVMEERVSCMREGLHLEVRWWHSPREWGVMVCWRKECRVMREGLHLEVRWWHSPREWGVMV